MKFDLSQILIKDKFYLEKYLKNPKQITNKLLEQYKISNLKFINRKKNRPKPLYDNTLPIHQNISDIKKILKNNQIIIVCGETGSGKTTQLPKICLDINCGISGIIGITQPRKIAAKNCASRIAYELKSNVGDLVGYKFRFNDKTNENNYIKIMTDGILLAEIQQDKYLLNYDTIIIDEAHERNLNIDFLIGYLKKIINIRKDLKIIISSATINAQIFSNHFKKNNISAPIINIPGKNFPVDIFYKPIDDDPSIDIYHQIITTIAEINQTSQLDILVFLPGEKEIRETNKNINKYIDILNNYEILPLYSKLSNQEQQKIFNPSLSNKKRIILATNVAETSITIPNIGFVIDTGTARIKRYSTRLKVEQLRIEKISQACAKQRTGRCGRTSKGTCIRLYDAQDFNTRENFTTPEILRSNLSAVILKMINLNLGEINNFPFIDKPNEKYINEGFRLLYDIQAIDKNKNITNIGKQIAKFPIDPKIARIIIEAKKNNCLDEILIIVSLLSIQDPKEIPFEFKENANKLYKKFESNNSDFIFYINLWNFFYKQRLNLSNNKLKNLCKEYYLSYNRMTEWFELHNQLYEILLEMELISNNNKIIEKIDPVCYERILKSLICGLINNIGVKSKENNSYLGVKTNNFYIFPNSTIANKKPLWIISAQLIETNKIYAINVSQINPIWIKDAIPHLVKYHYSNPHWSSKSQEVIANQKISLYNLTISDNINVKYGNIDPKISKEIFIYNTLINNERNFEREFLKHNENIINELSLLEHKSRKLNILVDDDVIYNFYNNIIPDYYTNNNNKNLPIVDSKSFLEWLDLTIKNNPKILFISKEYLMENNPENITEELFPKSLKINNQNFELNYRFEINHPLDGIVINVPIELLNQINNNTLEWLVPGFIREKIQILIKNLPKEIKKFIPQTKEFITDFLSSKVNYNNSLYSSLINFINNKYPQIDTLNKINFIKWKNKPIPEHLYFKIRLLNKSEEIKISKNLNELQKEFSKIATNFVQNNNYERENITTWNFPDIDKEIQINNKITAYLALKQENKSIFLRIFDTKEQAIQSHKKGTIALIALNLKDQAKDIKKLDVLNKFSIIFNNIKKEELTQDFINAIINKILDNNIIFSKNEFEKQFTLIKKQFPIVKIEFINILEKINIQLLKLTPLIKKSPDKLKIIINKQINTLIYPNFLTDIPWQYLQHFPRYLKGIENRMEKFNNDQIRDTNNQLEIEYIENKYINILEEYKKLNLTIPNDLKFFKWNIEELKISFFAQNLKTAYPVSIKRLEKILANCQNNYKIIGN